MWSWRGFTDLPGALPLGLLAGRRRDRGRRRLARWRRLPGVVVVLAQVVVGGAATCQVVADAALPGRARSGTQLSRRGRRRQHLRLAGARRPTRSRCSRCWSSAAFVAMLLVDLCAGTLRRVPLAGLPLLTVYSVPDEPDRPRPVVVGLRRDRDRLPAHAVPAGGGAPRRAGAARSTAAPQPVRRLSDSVRASALAVGSLATAAAVVRARWPSRPSASRSSTSAPAAAATATSRSPTRWSTCARTSCAATNVDLVRDPHRRPVARPPAHLGAQPLHRRTSGAPATARSRRPTSRRARCRRSRASTPRIVELRPTPTTTTSRSTSSFESRWLPDPGADQQHRRRRRLALRRVHHGLPLQRRRPHHGGQVLLDDRASELDVRLRPAARPRHHGTAASTTSSPSCPTTCRARSAVCAEQVTAGATTDFERGRAAQRSSSAHDGGFDVRQPSGCRRRGRQRRARRLPRATPPAVASATASSSPPPWPSMARVPRHPRPGRRRLPQARPRSSPATRGSTAPTTCTPGSSCTSPAPAGCCSTRRPTLVADGFLPGYADRRRRDRHRRSSRRSRSRPRAPRRARRPDQPSAPTTAPDQADDQDAGAGAGSGFPWLTVLVRPRQRPPRPAARAAPPRAAPPPARAAASPAVPRRPGTSCARHVVDLRLAWPEGRSPRETPRRPRPLVRPPRRHGEQRPARGPDLAPEAVAAIDRIVGQLERSRYSRRHAVDPGALRGRRHHLHRRPHRRRRPPHPPPRRLVAASRSSSAAPPRLRPPPRTPSSSAGASSSTSETPAADPSRRRDGSAQVAVTRPDNGTGQSISR